jgi:ESS family glutamate:Na+ symporter
MENSVIPVDALISFTLAILLLFCGKALVGRIELLRRYCIPEPLIGGLLCALASSLAYFALDLQIDFTLDVREILLLYFFAGIGLKSDVRNLIKGGRPLLVLTFLASLYIALQNALGMGVAQAFGLDPRAGLMLGSIALTGGVGTTLAWAPTFVNDLGIANAMELGMASNTVGLIAAGAIGGPVAHYLIRRHQVQASGDADLESGVMQGPARPAMTHYDVLGAWVWLNLALMIGHVFHSMLDDSSVVMPEFVSCLMAGILIRNLAQTALGQARLEKLGMVGHAMPLISDICLGMFLTMALMGLQLWLLAGIVGFILTALALQIIMSLVFTLLVVFRCLGGNYEASVMAAGFSGITLGSTATAIVNMSAVTKNYGAAHQAFIVVPLVSGFFIDLVNALLIGLFIHF